MAAELVGGAFLSASLQVLFDRLSSQELVDFINGKRPFDRLLKNLKIKLLSANMVLNDAEEKQIRNPSVKKWLDELKGTIFDAEDRTAEIKFQALECKMGGGSFSRSGTSQELAGYPKDIFDSMLLPLLRKKKTNGRYCLHQLFYRLRYLSFVLLVSARLLPAKEFPHLCQTSISFEQSGVVWESSPKEIPKCHV